MFKGNDKIKEYLLAKGLVGKDQLQTAQATADKSGISLEEALINQKVFDAEHFLSIKSDIFNLEKADLSEKSVDPAVLKLLSAKVAQNYKMVVFDKDGSNISVGMVDPGDFQAYEAIEFLVRQQGLTPKYYVITIDDFDRIFRQYGGFKKEIGTAVSAAKEKFAKSEAASTAKKNEKGNITQVVKTAPVAKIVSVIIEHAVEGGASDIHIEPGREEARVRYRVDGQLHQVLTLPNYLHQAVVSRIKVLANLKLDETRKPQDGRIKVNVDGEDIDLRVSVLPMLDAEKVVMRVLDNSAGVPTLTDLGFEPYHIDIIERNMKKPHGLFLLTGPTGSGKTTTLYSLLNMLNSDESNITTLEDPIEYYIFGINQSQIRPDVGFTFARGLRAILRQDPNIIMVGEIRDNETAELVIHAALTGHLVFSTLHTNNAWGAVPRLIDMGSEPFLLSSTLNLVMAQRLVRKICPDCKKEFKLPNRLQKIIDEEMTKIPSDYLKKFGHQFKFYKGAGCANCSHTGYVGRTVVSEVLEVKSEIKKLIAEGFTMEKVQEQLKAQKYITLFQDGILKALSGKTTIDEVLRVSKN